MATQTEKLGEQRAMRFLQQQQFVNFRDQLVNIEYGFGADNAAKHSLIIGAATGLTYLATKDLGAATAMAGFLTGMEILRKAPREVARKTIKRSLPLQASEMEKTEKEIALLEQSLSAGGLMSEEITKRLAALDQIERVKVQEAADKKAKEAELAKAESMFDRAVVGSRYDGSSNLDASALRWFTDPGSRGLNEWSAALRANGVSDINIVRHQYMRFKQLEGANEVRGDRVRITNVVDNLKKQLDIMEVVEARHKTSE